MRTPRRRASRSGQTRGSPSASGGGADRQGVPGYPADGVSECDLGTADCDSAAPLPSLAVHEGGVLFYWFLKFVAIGPAVHAIFRPRAEGTEHVPATGSAILASNHLSAADWIFMPLQLQRRGTFPAEGENFHATG